MKLFDNAFSPYAFKVRAVLYDPFFSRGRVHWRNDRLEAAVRLGLGPWLLEELEAGRAFFSPVP